MTSGKTEIRETLQRDILNLERFRPSNNALLDTGLGPIRHAFPDQTFPLGAVHEFLCHGQENISATEGFLTGLLSSLMHTSGTSAWISASRKLFPPALRNFNVDPDRFIFIDLKNENDVIAAADEALKCAALTTVVVEMKEISFTASRRLQLAVEESHVTGFILRNSHKAPNTTACVSRWRITSLPSEDMEDLPGIGFSNWRVELLRMRNGKPGAWDLQWKNGRFCSSPQEKYPVYMAKEPTRKAV
jgi:protein ImuA